MPSVTATLPPTPTPKPSTTATPVLTAIPTLAPLLLPGMAGFQATPTFDTQSAQPAAPASPPPCPAADPALALPAELGQAIAIFKTSLPFDLAAPIVDFLNQGGAPETLIQAVEAVDPELILRQDLTNDGQEELLLKMRYLSILGCTPDGQYKIFGQFIDDIVFFPPAIIAIQDLNRDGLPEMLLHSRTFRGLSTTLTLQVVAWNGQEIANMIGMPPAYPYRSLAEVIYWDEHDEVIGIMHELGDVELVDVDGNGTTEIIVHSGIPGHPDTFAHGPWRGGQDTFTWNGDAFVLLNSEIDPPVYRFQAVHDADQAALLGNYDQALTLYQEAIFSDQLAGWSPELYSQQMDLVNTWYNNEPTPTPYAPPAEEYYHLAGYARFRILVLHALRGYTVEAQTVYDTLQEEFSEGQPGHASALLATAFWQEYQATQNVGQACRYALGELGDGAEEILYWVGSSFHGWQFPPYKPVDLCPYGQTGTRE
jgi:hypothetical protein